MAQCHCTDSSWRIVKDIMILIFRFPGWTFAILGCCLSAIHCKDEVPHFTTMSTLQENQVFPSKDVKKIDGSWSWSQPDTTPSIVSDSQTLLPNFVSGNYFPGHNSNRVQGGAAQRAEYFPYQYEFGQDVEEPHHVPSTQGTENALGSITKHFATVSFIGLLLLFAIVQNSISTPQRKEVFSSRKRRDLIMPNGLDFTTPEEEEILSEDAKIRCIQRTLCLENQKLRKRLRNTGKLLANYLTREIKYSLKSSPGWNRLLEDAGKAGIRGEDCRILYRDCNSFEKRRQKVN